MLNSFIITLLYKNIVAHVLNIDLVRLFNVGFVLSVFYLVQILSGVLLALSFNTIHWSLGESWGGFWVVLAFLDQESLFWVSCGHIAGTSAVYGLVYIHVFKVIWTHLGGGLQPGILVSGVMIFILLVSLAFLGYVLPLSQMSYWGLVVFSNIIGVLPFFGSYALSWLWGGEFISGDTLVKVHLLHVMLPFVTVGVLILHLTFLHNNMSGCGFYDRGTTVYEGMFFACSASFKDWSALFLWSGLFAFLVFVYWTFVFHEESFAPFNPLATSAKIIPEWFFLVFFGFLKALPSKLGGLLCLLGNLLVLPFMFMFLSSECGSMKKGLTSNFSFLWLTLIGTLSTLASVVVLLYPLLEALSTSNLYFTLFVILKVF